MSIFNILLTALTLVPTNEGDTIQTERLDEVVVVSNSARQRIQGVQTGAEQLKLKELTASPQLFGERDIMRSLQLLAGVKGGKRRFERIPGKRWYLCTEPDTTRRYPRL